MTTEEAVEVILRGDRCTSCPTCLGAGTIGPAQVKEHYNILGQLVLTTTGVLTTCAGCLGKGNELKPEWLEACKVLGRSP